MTGTPPDEFVQRLQSADVSRSWAGAGGAGSCLALALYPYFSHRLRTT